MNNDAEKVKELIKGTDFEGKIEGIISLDDEIEFDCIRCGECCTGRDSNGEQIMLSPLDIYNGSKELGITPKVFVEKYTEHYVGHTSGVIIMTLACRDNGDCKFLKRDLNGLAKCRIHKSKPTICAIHPLGILHETNGKDSELEKRYIVARYCDNSRHGVMTKAKDIVACVKGSDEEIDAAMKVRVDWVPDNKLPAIVEHLMLHLILLVSFASNEERMEYGFSDYMYKSAIRIRKLFEKNVGPLNMNAFVPKIIETNTSMRVAIESINMEYSYLHYDTSKPFLEQCLENIKTLTEFGENLLEYDEMVMEDIAGNLTEEQIEKIPAFIKMYPTVMGFQKIE